jgi:hypothetical protein
MKKNFVSVVLSLGVFNLMAQNYMATTTTSPGNMRVTHLGGLTVNGSIQSMSNYGLELAPPSGDAIIYRSTPGNLVISSNGGSSGVRFNYSYGGGSGGISVYDGGTINHADFAVNSSGNLNISPTGGNVGVGTFPPQTKLDLGDLRFDAISSFPAEGSVMEGKFGNYIIGDVNSLQRLRLGVSNDGYTRSEIFLDNSNRPDGTIAFKTANDNGGAKTRMFINGSGDVRIGGINDAGNIAVALGGLANQYNLDFSGYRDVAFDQIGARISALRFNVYGNNNALIQNTGLAFYTNPSGMNGGITDLQERMRIDPYGKVGIGTAIPTTDLHIGNTTGGGIRIGKINDAGNITVAVGLQTAQYNLDFSGYRDNTQDQIGARIAALRFNNYTANNALIQNAGLAFYTNPSGVNGGTTDLQERMRISPSGYVGIGTTSPDALLTVSGQVHAQEVKVTVSAPGPDYVFENDYKLTSLEEIKNYIDQNKHLPEVPSAKEMEKNGVQLGEMNMLLLKKIEELTLYQIESNKKIELMQRQIESLQKNKL